MAYIIRPPGPTYEKDPPSQSVAAAVENDSITGSEKAISSMVNTFADVFSVWKPPVGSLAYFLLRVTGEFIKYQVHMWDFKRFNSKEQPLTAHPNASNINSPGTVHGSDSRMFAVPLVNRKSQHAQRREGRGLLGVHVTGRDAENLSPVDTARLYAMTKQGRLTCRNNLG
ncbi:hypothetical protein SpCBS45565_g02919 [Spizellomyces sp. 'palustris']|nr:hypothetical protein SpCBS45565_g02919 [Spizellomyces sp. 'palustris']